NAAIGCRSISVTAIVQVTPERRSPLAAEVGIHGDQIIVPAHEMPSADRVDGAIRCNGRCYVESRPLRATVYRRGHRIRTWRPGEQPRGELDLAGVVWTWHWLADDSRRPEHCVIAGLGHRIIRRYLDQPRINGIVAIEAGADSTTGDPNHVVIDIPGAVG